MLMRYTRTIKLALFLILVLGCSFGFNRGKALAINNNGAQIPTTIRNAYELTAGCAPFNYGQDSWVSRRFDTANLNPITISQGTNSVDLWYNMLSSVCNNNITSPVYPSGTIITKDKTATRFRVTGFNSDGGTSVTDISGQAIDLNSQSYNEAYFTNSRYIVMPIASGFTFPNHADFTLSGLGGLTPGLHTIHVNATTRPIHQYTDGSFKCVVLVTFMGVPNVVQPASSLDDPACQQRLDSVTVIIDVQPTAPLPTLTITDNCTGVNLSTNGSDIHVYNVGFIGSTGGPSGNFTLNTNYSPGVLLDYYALPGSGTAGTNYQPHVWNPPPSCSNFTYEVKALSSSISLSGPLTSPTVSYGQSTTVTYPGGGTFTSIRPGNGIVPSVFQTISVTHSGATSSYSLSPYAGILPNNKDFSGSTPLSNLTPGDVVCVSIRVTPATGTINPGEIIQTGSGSSTDQSCLTVSDSSYVSFYGNDIYTGATFTSGASCPLVGNAGIDVPSKLGAGSSSQFAAFGYHTVSGILSASLRTSSPVRPNGLTFANYPGITGFGGSFQCIPDYYTAISAGGTNTGNIIGPLTIGLGEHKSFYSTGDLYINGDIQFATGWTTRDSIPSLYIVARNIYIGRNVQRLDGVYIAQPSTATNGRIYTCASSAGNLYPLPALYANCGGAGTPGTGPLTVNGAFIAKRIRFLRTSNTVGDAVAGESAATSKAAEIFNFTPETYLAIPPNSIKQATPGSSNPYDYFSNLPPAL